MIINKKLNILWLGLLLVFLLPFRVEIPDPSPSSGILELSTFSSVISLQTALSGGDGGDGAGGDSSDDVDAVAGISGMCGNSAVGVGDPGDVPVDPGGSVDDPFPPTPTPTPTPTPSGYPCKYSNFPESSGDLCPGICSPSVGLYEVEISSGVIEYWYNSGLSSCGSPCLGTRTSPKSGVEIGNLPICAVSGPLPPAPDLTAGSVSPASATAGSSTIFSATITNSGTASTVTPFINLFQKATDVSGTDATDIGTFASSALAAGSQITAALSYTFPSAGTFYMRVCADKDSAASSGAITESNEGNNCGGWTNITVSNAPIKGSTPTATLSASPSTIDRGQSSTLYWNSTDATSCTGTGFTAGGPSGSRSTGVLNTAGTYNYQVTCSGVGGTSAPAFASVLVLAPDLNISSDPSRVNSGESVTISWNATGVNSCTVSGPGLSSTSQSGSQSVTITAQSTYTINCTTNGTPVTNSVTVNVTPFFKEF